MTEPTLVVGGTGTLGRAIVRRLIARGDSVRILTRQTGYAPPPGATTVAGDLVDAESVARACEGAKRVVACAHSLLGRGRYKSENVDATAHERLIAECRRAGVEHFVYLSIRGAAPDHPVPLWRWKARIEAALEASDLRHTVIRPAAFMEFHLGELICRPLLAGKRVMLLGPGTNPRNFVAVDDVARCVVEVLDRGPVAAGPIEMGGPETLTTRQAVELCETIFERKARVSSLPLSLVSALHHTFRPVHPGVAQVLLLGTVTETTDQTFASSLDDPSSQIGKTGVRDWLRQWQASTSP